MGTVEAKVAESVVLAGRVRGVRDMNLLAAHTLARLLRVHVTDREAFARGVKQTLTGCHANGHFSEAIVTREVGEYIKRAFPAVYERESVGDPNGG